MNALEAKFSSEAEFTLAKLETSTELIRILADFKQILFMPTLGSLLILQQNGSTAIALPFPLDAFYFHSKFGSIAPTVILSPVVAPSMPSNRTS